MDISPTSQPAGRSGGFAAGAPASPGGGLINSDFETFLKMLTAQMKHQDPLNPVDSTQFATQLATFSSVEQQVRTNELLTALGAQMGALSVSQLSGWVGMIARAEMPVHFDGQPVTISTRTADRADRADLVVRDEAGTEIQRLPIDIGRQELDWAGVSDSGAPLPAGIYKLSVESYATDELIASNPVYVHARIVEARNEDGRPIPCDGERSGGGHRRYRWSQAGAITPRPAQVRAKYPMSGRLGVVFVHYLADGRRRVFIGAPT